MIFRLTTLCFLLFFSLNIYAQKVKEPQHNPADWSRPFAPFRIAGNLYYVGTYDLASYLIVTNKGNILINTGLAGSLQTIKESINILGFKFNDIKILLTMQAHFDHVGAMAAIKKQTGAKFYADAADAAILKSGGATDYELSYLGISFKPIKPDSLLHNKAVIQLGDTKLVMLHHPGHTKGSCSYIVTVHDDNRSYNVLLANMPSIIVDKKFSEVTTYPGIETDYAYTLKAMKQLKFDIWLAAHAGQFHLHEKHKPGDPYNPKAFFDSSGYTKALDELEQGFIKKQQQQ